jgi:ATP-dependent helicase/nuclease subunit A
MTKDDEDAREYRDQLSSILKDLNNICFWDNESEIRTSIYQTKPYVVSFINIISEFDKRLKQYKYDNDLYAFNDIANLAIKLVKENSSVRDEIKNSFVEILVDEYQDTNDLQEGFISLIGNNNIYMVGDIKQSIYRFRNANPDIFKHKYDEYSQNNGGIKIDLNKNFRSRREVLNSINLVFDNIMDKNLGGADYKRSHRLEYGNLSYEEEGKTKQNNDLEIYNYHFDKELGFKKDEIEIFLIANDIRNKINNHYQVLDNHTLRSVTYSDFVILLDRGNSFDLYKKIFNYMKIPLTIHKDESIAVSSDILVIKSLLKLILCLKNKQEDNEFKYAFMSVGRSFLYSYSDNDLFSYIINNTYKETDLYTKALRISKQVDSTSIDNILNLTISEFNVYEHLIKIGNVSDMIERIDYLVNNAKTLAKMGYNLETFINYLSDNFNEKSDIKISSNKEDSNTCRIMNIHKSKGLEFNICYYAGVSAEFNIRDLNEMFYYDPYYGFITPYFNEGICHTIYKVLLKEKYLKEEIEEKIRLLYVSLTRCREKMIIVTDLDNKEKTYSKEEDGLISLFSRLSYRSFKDMFSSVKDSLTPYINNIDDYASILSHDYNTKINNDYQKRIPISNTKITQNIIKIDSSNIVESSYSKKISSLLDKKAHDIIKMGKDVHHYLEIIDFKNPNLDIINSPYKNKVIAFLKQDILSNIENANIYKEYEFIFIENNEEHHGIIDLMLEFDDHIKIIDYKLKNIDSIDYEKQLKGYLQYIESISNKRVDLYLYSIVDEKYRVIK